MAAPDDFDFEGAPREMDEESLAAILEAYEAALEAIQATGNTPDVLLDVCRLMLLAAAGWYESRGDNMPPSKQAVRNVLGMLTGLLRANGDF